MKLTIFLLKIIIFSFLDPLLCLRTYKNLKPRIIISNVTENKSLSLKSKQISKKSIEDKVEFFKNETNNLTDLYENHSASTISKIINQKENNTSSYNSLKTIYQKNYTYNENINNNHISNSHLNNNYNFDTKKQIAEKNKIINHTEENYKSQKGIFNSTTESNVGKFENNKFNYKNIYINDLSINSKNHSQNENVKFVLKDKFIDEEKIYNQSNIINVKDKFDLNFTSSNKSTNVLNILNNKSYYSNKKNKSKTENIINSSYDQYTNSSNKNEHINGNLKYNTDISNYTSNISFNKTKIVKELQIPDYENDKKIKSFNEINLKNTRLLLDKKISSSNKNQSISSQQFNLTVFDNQKNKIELQDNLKKFINDNEKNEMKPSTISSKIIKNDINSSIISKSKDVENGIIKTPENEINNINIVDDIFKNDSENNEEAFSFPQITRILFA